jgi:hypothetical protein
MSAISNQKFPQNLQKGINIKVVDAQFGVQIFVNYEIRKF